MEAAKRIFSITDEQPKIDILEHQAGKIIADSEKMKGEIEFKDVWFRYPTRKENWILRGISFKINSKENVGLVGESGSGKSTITQLIYRFYDPQFGKITIDGIDIKDYDVQSLRKCFGLVQQEPLLFNYSIRDNILYAKTDATDDEVREAAQVANAVEFIATLRVDPDEKEQKEMLQPSHSNAFSTLPEGYNLSCGAKGSKLSGGQKQRIAIARAIIRQPKILMLDEATSALDEESQKKVQEALERIMVGRTSIIIAHRLTTIQKCDRLLVLDQGKVSEEGTFSDLRSRGGHFAQISNDLKN
jgi:ATP-binding cassette, subfamily B (MDR/TAP), member 1